ncbi:hypothetical protein BH10ACI1_BH10ACI1_12460 [soil metagenome]
MTEALEKVKGIKYLPIVYTPQMVLLPYLHEKLKIGTLSHRQLIKDASHDNKFFGINFLDKNSAAATDKPEIGSIGCVAEMKRIKLSAGGGKIVELTGVIRYIIENYIESGEGYTVAEVTFFEDEPEDEEILDELILEAAKIIQQIFIKSLETVGKKIGEPPLLKGFPMPSSFIYADLFMFGNDTRQLFLQYRLTSERLKACIERLIKFEDATENILFRQKLLKPFYSISNPHKPHLG